MQREAEVRDGKAVGSGLSTTFTPMSDWIIDRPPTEADADRDGDVAVKQRPGSDGYAYLHWSFVKPGMVWRRTSHWYAAVTTPTSQPRRIVSIALDADYSVAAVADDGTAWWLSGDGTKWAQMPALPDRE